MGDVTKKLGEVNIAGQLDKTLRNPADVLRRPFERPEEDTPEMAEARARDVGADPLDIKLGKEATVSEQSGKRKLKAPSA